MRKLLHGILAFFLLVGVLASYAASAQEERAYILTTATTGGTYYPCLLYTSPSPRDS